MTKSKLAGSVPATEPAAPVSGTPQERAQEALRKFRVVFSSVKKHFQDVESRCGVTGAQLWAISEIARSPGLRVSDLARAMSVHQSTASNLVGDLERKSLIRKERGADQRVVRLYLSPHGQQVVERAPKPMIGVLPDALQKLPEDVLDSLSANMDVLIATMQLKDEAAAAKPLSDI
jgi:DNA-binding MarR family transcriptional regulator